MGQSTEELTDSIEESRRNLSRNVDELSDKVSPGKVVHRQKQAAVNRLSAIRESVMGTASEAGSTVTGRASDVADSAQEAAHNVAHGAQGAVRTAKGNPLAAGLAAFGVGLVVSSMIPASRQEADVARKAVDAAKEQAQPMIEEGAQNLKDAATSAAGDLMETAQDAAAHVQEEAKSSAETVKDEASSSAETVKDEAAGATQSLKETAGGSDGVGTTPIAPTPNL